MGDLCEIILAHGSLFDGEWTVVGCHNIQGVTVAEESETAGHIHYSSSRKKPETLASFIAFNVINCSVFLTFPAGSLGNLEWWGPGVEGAR